MAVNDDQLASAYRAATRPATRAACPASAALVSLALEGRAGDGVLAHVSDCSACAEEVRALAAASGGMPDAERRDARSSLAVAALLLLTIGLSAVSTVLYLRGRRLEERLAAAERVVQVAPPAVDPRAPAVYLNIPIVDLEPPDALRGGAHRAVVDLPAADAFTLILNTNAGPGHGDYALEIADTSGRVVWQARGLRRSPQDTFTLGLERRLLPDGELSVHLYGIDGETRTRLESYRIRIRE